MGLNTCPEDSSYVCGSVSPDAESSQTASLDNLFMELCIPVVPMSTCAVYYMHASLYCTHDCQYCTQLQALLYTGMNPYLLMYKPSSVPMHASLFFTHELLYHYHTWSVMDKTLSV